MGNEKGLVHVYTGDGKGKTTACVGLCARCAGYGEKVAFYEFLKGSKTGEAMALKKLGVEVYCPVETEKFVFTMTNDEKLACIERQNQTLAHAQSNMSKYKMVVLDEVLSAIVAGVIEESVLIDFIKNKEEKTELVLSGRGASNAIKQLANYVSVINAEKHPYSEGIMARKGIEF